jgi:uncharacterized protein YdeI (BOF family)
MLIKKFILALIVTGLTLSQANAQSPYAMEDDSWISLSGTVQSIDGDSFVLDYGEGTINVELEDWDWYPETSSGLVNETVTVSGMIDDDFFETAEINADSVYLDRLNSYYWVNPQATYTYYYPYADPVDTEMATIEGQVTEIHGDHEFSINTGNRAVRVEVDMLPETGLDELTVGDRIRANGEMDYDLFEGREFDAQTFSILR